MAQTRRDRGRPAAARVAPVSTNDTPWRRFLSSSRRAMSRFLALPLAIVVAFLLLTVGLYLADIGWSNDHVPIVFPWLGSLFGDGHAIAGLLSTLTSSIFTVTSITFSLLLIALQQGAAALTTKVTDQFLMRWSNQFFFGYFVGLSIFVLLNLATASDVHRPVFGTTAAILLAMVALCLIVVMIYSTIEQMQPTKIVRQIHRHVLDARVSQSALLRRTRRAPRPDWTPVATLRAQHSGHVVAIDADALRAGVFDASPAPLEVELVGSIGRYLAHGDPLAVLRSADGAALAPGELDALRAAVFAALTLDVDRDLKHDPAYGIEQLATIGWTSVSTAKSNPAPGLDILGSLRDILSRWGQGGEIEGDPASLLVVADAAPRAALDALEDLFLVASESMQAQTLARVLETLAILLAELPQPWAERLADVARRGLSSLGEHVLTSKLDAAIDRLAEALDGRGFGDVAGLLRDARGALAGSLGTLNSRSTRVPSGG